MPSLQKRAGVANVMLATQYCSHDNANSPRPTCEAIESGVFTIFAIVTSSKLTTAGVRFTRVRRVLISKITVSTLNIFDIPATPSRIVAVCKNSGSWDRGGL